MKIERKDYTVTLDEPVLYVDNESRGRSGHMSHALVEYEKGKLIDFNSNCSAKRFEGHSTFGFIEYRTSMDGGETYSPVKKLPYAWETFLDGVEAISVEKAVSLGDGRAVALCLRNTADRLCAPWYEPTAVYTDDGGETWSAPYGISPYAGRIYDACAYGGTMYFLEFCNSAAVDWLGAADEHLYRIFKSTDRGAHFEELCVVPIPTYRRGYGAMLFDNAGKLHVYAYNIADPMHLDHVVSADGGATWSLPDTCYLKMGIRNPQIGEIDGVYILHGRAHGQQGFVLYTSTDATSWDEGTVIGTVKGLCYYSNNITLADEAGKSRMLIQYSEAYNGHCVNVYHRFLTVEKN